MASQNLELFVFELILSKQEEENDGKNTTKPETILLLGLEEVEHNLQMPFFLSRIYNI